MPESAQPSNGLDTHAAIAALYETHFERVSRYIAVRIGHITEAEDLASEVFVRALRSVESYQATGAPMEAWLFRIAHNLVVDHLRQRGRRPAAASIDETFDIGSEENPSAALEKQEDVAELKRALAGLSDAQRQVLGLRFGGELSSEAVAHIMGKKPGAVREMQSAAVRKLRDLLTKQRASENDA